MKNMGKELCFHYVDGLINERPKNYHCPLADSLVINENGNILPCCAIDDRSLGKVLEYTGSDIIEKKKDMEFCTECRELGADYWVTNPLVPEFEKRKIVDLHMEEIMLHGESDYVLFGAGKDGKYMADFLRKRKGKIRYFIDNDLKKQGTTIDGIHVKSVSDLTYDKDKAVILITSERYKNQIKSMLLDLGKKEREDFYYYEDFLEQYLIENMK